VEGSPFPSGKEPGAVAIDPAGTFAYVANAGSDDVSSYAIDPATGALRDVLGATTASLRAASR
jgi:DNA-binding beta-propeller fold protein YncE